MLYLAISLGESGTLSPISLISCSLLLHGEEHAGALALVAVHVPSALIVTVPAAMPAHATPA